MYLEMGLSVFVRNQGLAEMSLSSNLQSMILYL